MLKADDGIAAPKCLERVKKRRCQFATADMANVIGARMSSGRRPFSPANRSQLAHGTDPGEDASPKNILAKELRTKFADDRQRPQAFG